MRVTVIDYKAGNLTSVVKALRHLGADLEVTEEPEVVARGERIILPGVGHFAATERLDARGITASVRDAIARGTPFLGICVGMQWLLEGSEEAPAQRGLGAFSGRCERFPQGSAKVPHVGWNSLQPHPRSRLLQGISAGDYAYFTHAYRVPIREEAAATTDYITPFASAVEKGNTMGVQFHPEKSGEAGLGILQNFLEMKAC